MDFSDNYLLTLGTFLPMVGVLVMLFIPGTQEKLHKEIAILTSGATLGRRHLTLRVRLRPGRDAPVRRRREWIEVIKSNYTIGIDGISLPLYILSMFVTFLVVIYSWDNIPDAGNPKAFLMLTLVLQVGMAGTFVAQDLVLFFVFFEVVLLPMYFMIGVWGGEQRQYASLKFFLYTMFGSAADACRVAGLVLPDRCRSFGCEASDASRRRDPAPRIQLDLRRLFIGFAVKVRCSRSTRGCPTPTPRRRQGSVILAATS